MKPESHYALIPRRVVLNRMETADCLEARVHWAIILWSWCGPGRTEDGAVVVKDRRGFIQRDGAGNQIPARAIDLLQLLGLAAGMKGNLSRAIARLKMKGVIRFEGKVMYSVDSPPIIEDSGSCQYQQLSVANIDNWNVAGVVVKADQLPSDPTEKRVLIEWLDSFKNEFNRQLSGVTSHYRELFRSELRARGIITVLEKKKSREEVSRSVGQSEESEPPEDRLTDTPESTPEPPEPPPAEPAPTIEEVRALIIEETAQTHPDEVPGDPVCRDTVSALQGAPVERLRRAIRERFRPRDKIGRIAYLAKDVGELWAMQRQEQLKLEAEQRSREREAWEWQAENDQDEDARQVARAKLIGKT